MNHVSDQEIRGLLEKQLQLLSERSERMSNNGTAEELERLTYAMSSLYEAIMRQEEKSAYLARYGV